MFRERFRFDLQRFDDITNSSSNTLVSGTSINDTIWNPSYGDTVTINAGAGNDFIKNYGDYVTISAGIGNDTINNNCTDALTPYDDEDGSYVLFKYSEGDGNDIIYGFKANSTLSITGSSYSSTTSGSNVIFTVGSGKITLVGASSLGSSLNLKFKSKGVTINNTNFDSLISGTSGNDSIYNNAGGDTIDSGAGNDTIITYYHNDNSIKSGAGNDFISLYSAFYYTVDAGDGNDTILSSRPYNGFANSLNGGAGNDLISLKTDYYDEGTTIKGGTGNDTIYGNSGSSITYGLTYQYSSGDGNDIIYNFTSYDKISLGGGTYIQETVGSNVVLGIGSGSITLSGASTLTSINIVGGTLDPGGKGTEGNDSITNTVSGATINALGGNDTIYNNNGDSSSINAGAGNDSIYAYDNDNVTVVADAGNDTVVGAYWSSKIYGGTGNDKISITGSWYSNTVDGGDGSDTITAYGGSLNGGAGNDRIDVTYDRSTVKGGTGNDTISLYSGTYNDLIQYSSGDGNDVIYNFQSANDTLKIGNGTSDTYYSVKSGSDIVVSVGSGAVTLKSVSSANIAGTYKNPKLVTLTSGADNYTNTVSGATINALGGNDSIYNTLSSVKIDGGTGNDSINNDGSYSDSVVGSKVTIIGGEDDDYIYNMGSYVTINAGAGNDKITIDSWDSHGGRYTSIEAGDGNDTIRNYSNYVTINGGAGKDSIVSGYSSIVGNNVTINAGTGDDFISLVSPAKNHLIQYASGEGNDIIYGFNNYDTISLGGGTYTRSTVGSNVVLGIGSGSITLNGATSLSTINIVGGTLDSVIRNSTASVSVSGTSGNDTIYNSGNYVTISAGKGNDSIYNAASYAKIDAGAGADTIYNSSGWYYSTINGGAGNDFIRGYFWDSSVAGGAGNDRISMGGDVDRATINPGTGNDTVYMDNYDGRNYYQYTSGDGNDIIYNWNTYDTLKIGNGTGTYSSQVSGSSNVIVTVGEGNITLVGARGLSTINILGTGESPIWRLNGTTATYGTSSNTSISVSNVKSLDGISLSGKVVTIANSSVNKKKIALTGDGYTLNLASGVPAPSTKKAAWSLDGTTATYKSSYKTAGYTLASNSKSITYTKATTATPLATLTGIKATKGLSVSGKVITVAKSAVNATNISINSDEGYTLALANDVSAPATKKAAWSLNGTTATYKGTYKTAGYTLAKNSKSITYTKATTAKTLATLTGIKATKGLSVSGKVITVAKSAVNATNIAITDGEGYTLALANDVSAPSTKKEAWSLNGTTATYKGTYKTEGYTLAKNSKSITYTAATTPKTLATLTGIKATKGLSVSGKVITVAKSAVNAEKISLTGSGYTLKLADGLAPETKKAAWSIKDSTATYKSSYKTAGYTLAKNSKSVTYSKATTANTLATIKGAASTNGLSVSGSKITLKDTALSSKVTIGGSYDFNFASGYKTATITGSSNADTITTNGTKLSVSGGTGNDSIKVLGSTTTIMGGAGNDSIFSNSKGKNVFVYNSGDGKDVITDFAANDTIKIVDATAKVTTSGSDVVFTVGKGAITLKNAADKNISYSDKGGKKTYSAPKPDKPYKFNDNDPANATAVTLSSSFSAKTFYSTDDVVGGYELITIDASAVTKTLDIMGNDNSNLIIGGKKADTIDGGAGDDTLTGGAGADIFLYFDGDGDDVITDYAAIDKIKISGKSVEPENSGRDVVLKVGEGKITVKNAVRNNIDVTYIENGIECAYIGGERTVSINGATVTLNDNYRKDIFDISNAKGITRINASGFSREGLTIKGNAEKNIITSAKGNCTLIGGKDDDELFGDDGATNVYVYNNGDGDDKIYNYGTGDKISIASGKVSNITSKGDNVIFTVGKGKISVMGAANRDIYYSVGGKDSIRYADENNTTGNLFDSEDDIFLDDSNAQLNSIIKNNSIDHSYSDFEDSTNLIKENNLIAYGGKK